MFKIDRNTILLDFLVSVEFWGKLIIINYISLIVAVYFDKRRLKKFI